tara:strand:- start:335 stop:523 length:189 start_codon:yes stop_codon:yes gene_type:complete
VINFIKSFFRKDPGAKIRSTIAKKQEQAMQLQRNGKLREYAEIVKEIEVLEAQYDESVNENR